MKLADTIKEFLIESINTYARIEIEEDETLDFQEQFKHHEPESVEDSELEWDSISSDEAADDSQCTKNEDEISFDYKKKAVEFWRSGKTKNLNIRTVAHRFKKVISKTQLKRWAHQINKGGTYKEKLNEISQYTLNRFIEATECGKIVHDIDLRRWALTAHKNFMNSDARFKASKEWVNKFKRAHRITSRKITKFITRKTLEDSKNLKKTAEEFTNNVKSVINDLGLENVYNSDQSGFQFEMHSGRTLANQGSKEIECVVQSISSTTHSYTIQPTISADGKLLSPLYLVLKEIGGDFGPRVEKTLFKPTNVFVSASKSGKLTSDHFKQWLTEIYFPNVGDNSALLIDSWSGHCSEVVDAVTPPNKKIVLKIIPKGTTGQIQPLDVFGFRIWKNFVRHFSDIVILSGSDINLHLRNNIIKLQSLVHNQLSSPRYINMLKYAWYKSGYIEKTPPEFINLVTFGFGDNSEPRCHICGDLAVITCSWCKKPLCLKHFFEEYHYCNEYIP
ncbi:uncharacterized protein LOC124410191 isoform X2 [Diprion similis]|nr:uncharacterized protein LOC124410191 isoform X2 [Diprion similis]